MEVHEYSRNRGKYICGCLTGVPTFGLVSAEFALSLATTQSPLNWNSGIHMEHGRAVDVARNNIVEKALSEGYTYVFFRDDDVHAPPDVLNKLFSLRVPIAAAVVWGKQWPTHPMVFRWGEIGSYEDWQYGDIFEIDGWTGMGCTLIHRSVFEAIEPPWFKTEAGTVIQKDDGTISTAAHTEDVYFYMKAREAGIKPVVDTGIDTVHIDVTSDRRWFWNRPLNQPCLVEKGRLYVYPPMQARPATIEKIDEISRAEDVPEIVRFNLGCGASVREGFINVDLNNELADEHGDCSDIGWLVQKYGLADEIYSSHLLEHFRMEQIGGVLKNWTNSLKPGGLFHLIVPDFEWTLEQFLNAGEDDPEKYNRKMQEIFGLLGEGMAHQSGLTKAFLMDFLKQCRLAPIDLSIHPPGTPCEPDPSMTLILQEIRICGTRMGADDDASGTSEGAEPTQLLSGNGTADSEQVEAETDSQN